MQSSWQFGRVNSVGGAQLGKVAVEQVHAVLKCIALGAFRVEGAAEILLNQV